MHLIPLHCARQGPAESSPPTFRRVGGPVAGDEGGRAEEGATGSGRERAFCQVFLELTQAYCLLLHLPCNWVSVCLAFLWARSLLRAERLLWTSLSPVPVQAAHKCLWTRQGNYSLACKLRRAGTCVSLVNCYITST